MNKITQIQYIIIISKQIFIFSYNSIERVKDGRGTF